MRGTGIAVLGMLVGLGTDLIAQSTLSLPAFAVSDAGRIQLVDPHTGATTVLVADVAYDRPMAWSPDRHLLLYWKHSDVGWDVWRIARSGDDACNLTHTESGGCRMPAWCPDGERIAYMRDLPNGLHVMDRDGANARQLTTRGHRDMPPSWSPDGERVLYGWFEEDEEHDVVWHTNRITLATGEDVPLTTSLRSVRDARYSPVKDDVLVLGKKAREPSGIHLVAADGTSRCLVHGEEGTWFDRLAWHPHGTSFAFVRARRGEASVEVFDVATETSREFLDSKRVHDLSWAPGGTHLLVIHAVDDTPSPTVIEASNAARRDYEDVPARQGAW